MKGTLSKLHWTTGELRPDLWGATDLTKYQAGLKKLLNGFVNKAGVLLNCPGTETIMPGKFPTKTTRSIPFKFSFNQQYVFLFGDKYMHIIEDGVPVFNQFPVLSNYQYPGFINTLPNAANPTLVMNNGSGGGITGSQIANGMLVQIQPSNSTLSPNVSRDIPLASNDMSLFFYNRWFIIQNVNIQAGNTSFTLTDLNGNQISTVGLSAYNNNLRIRTVYELTTPYAHTDLALLNFAQSFDIVQLRHPDYAPQELKRITNSQFTITTKNYFPTQFQGANSLAASGGESGPNYYYKVTTYNKTTKQESLPCPIALQTSVFQQNILTAQSLNHTGGGQVIRLSLVSVSGLAVGEPIQVSTPIIYTNPSGHQFTWLFPGTNYSIFALDAVYNFIDIFVGDQYPVATLSFNSGGYVFANAYSSTALQILSIGNGNPMLITTRGPHGLVNGQEVTPQGTGVFGLDGLTFNATVQSPTTLSLNGVDGSNYDLSGFVPSDYSIISSTVIISTALSPSVSDSITISGLVKNPSIYTSDTVFNIYASTQLNSGYGYIGSVVPSNSSSTFTFVDAGIPPDSTLSPKSYTPLFIGKNNYPSDCNYYQQRLIEFATNNNPQGVFASVIGDYNDFTVHNPIQQNDAIIINTWSNQLNKIFHSAESGFLILLTDMGPMVLAGDTTGEFTPETSLIKRGMFAGAAQQPRPLTIFKNVIYMEASQISMRDLDILVTPFYTYIDKSDNVSLFSEHLLQASPIVTWDYAMYPDSQIYSVRQDGVMVLTTYFKEQEMNSFSRRNTNGGIDKFLDVVCVQEGTQSFPYPTVQRSSGVWIERMASRYYTDPTIDAIFTDATASYDGLVEGFTATLSGGTTFGSSITAALSNNPFFDGTDFLVGWQVNFKVDSGTVDVNGLPIYWFARMIVTGNTANSVTGTLMEAIEPNLLGMTISDIRVASNVVGGLWHLNGQQVSVVADGMVVADVNDNSSPAIVVTNGSITLPNSYGVINVGLPYYTDVQTLDLDDPKGETYMDKFISVPRVTMKIKDTGALWVGPDFTENLPTGVQMDRAKIREFETYDSQTNLFTGIVPVSIDQRSGYGGSFAIRNSQPLPMTLLSLAPLVEVQK